jgi:hypothetical protein
MWHRFPPQLPRPLNTIILCVPWTEPGFSVRAHAPGKMKRKRVIFFCRGRPLVQHLSMMNRVGISLRSSYRIQILRPHGVQGLLAYAAGAYIRFAIEISGECCLFWTLSDLLLNVRVISCLRRGHVTLNPRKFWLMRFPLFARAYEEGLTPKLLLSIVGYESSHVSWASLWNAPLRRGFDAMLIQCWTMCSPCVVCAIRSSSRDFLLFSCGNWKLTDPHINKSVAAQLKRNLSLFPKWLPGTKTDWPNVRRSQYNLSSMCTTLCVVYLCIFRFPVFSSLSPAPLSAFTITGILWLCLQVTIFACYSGQENRDYCRRDPRWPRDDLYKGWL